MSSYILLAFLAISLCAAKAAAADLDWWKTAVFYQIYPRSFKDSNNDGTGDIGGMIEKLDHLAELGVTAVWLSPIYRSPQVDHGYDISDFRDVDPIFGDLDTLKSLIAKCHAKGIKVVLDFVPNHTSDKHRWFIQSESGDPEYENYYVWKDAKPDRSPPNNWISHFHGPAWTFSENRQKYYLHQFAAGQPDLNYWEPKVVEEMKDVLRYWLKLGVDGFRMDIVPTLFEHPDFPDEPESHNVDATPNDHDFLDHIYTYDQPDTYNMVHEWRLVLDDYQKQTGEDTKVMMIETYSPDQKAWDYYGNASKIGAHFPFNFWFITKLDKNSKAGDFKSVIEKWLGYTDPRNFTANWVLGNHDQHRVASRYGPERVDGLAMLSLLLPGVGVIYNGEEIGMENGEVIWTQGKDPQACNGLETDFNKNSRDFQRTPFQWDDTVNAGFNLGAETWLPVGSKYKEVNRKKQIVGDMKSHYRIYQELLKIRKHDTVKRGKTQIVALNENVIALTRTLAGNETFLVLINIGNKLESFNLATISDLPEKLTIKIRSVNSNHQIGDEVLKKVATLNKYEAFVATGVVGNSGNNGTDGNGNNNNNNGGNNTNNNNSAPSTCACVLYFVIFVCIILMKI